MATKHHQRELMDEITREICLASEWLTTVDRVSRDTIYVDIGGYMIVVLDLTFEINVDVRANPKCPQLRESDLATTEQLVESAIAKVLSRRNSINFRRYANR